MKWERQVDARKRLGISRQLIRYAVQARKMRTKRMYGLLLIDSRDVDSYKKWRDTQN